MNKKGELLLLILIMVNCDLLTKNNWFKGSCYYQGRFDQAYKYAAQSNNARAGQLYMFKRKQKLQNAQLLECENTAIWESKKSDYFLGIFAEYIKNPIGSENDFLLFFQEITAHLHTILQKRLERAHNKEQEKWFLYKNSVEKKMLYLLLSKNTHLLKTALDNNMGPNFYQESGILQDGNAKSAALIFSTFKSDTERQLYSIVDIKKPAVLHACIQEGFDIHNLSGIYFTLIQKLLEQRADNSDYAWLFDRFFNLVSQTYIIPPRESITGKKEILEQKFFPDLERKKIIFLQKKYCSDTQHSQECISIKKMIQSLDELYNKNT